MNNIRISIDLLKVAGARIARFPNSAGTKTNYICIPADQCFVPKDSARPYLMATMIHCPNAKYGDFMLKPYVSRDDYDLLSADERRNIPVIGKGTFIAVDNNRAVSASAEDVDIESVETLAADNQVPSNGPAATSPNAPSPASGGQMTFDEAIADYWCYSPEGWVQGFSTLNDAKAWASGKEIERPAIIKIVANEEVDRWNWSAAQIDWVKAPSKRR